MPDNKKEGAKKYKSYEKNNTNSDSGNFVKLLI